MEELQKKSTQRSESVDAFEAKQSLWFHSHLELEVEEPFEEVSLEEVSPEVKVSTMRLADELADVCQETSWELDD